MLAVFAAAGSSFDQEPQRDRVDEIDGELWSYPNLGGPARVSTDDGRTWESASVAYDTNGTPVPPQEPTEAVTEHCLTADRSICVRLSDDRTVEESVDGGATWQVGWQFDDRHRDSLTDGHHGHSDIGGWVSLADIHETSTGTVLIAAGNLDPVRRGADGEWAPTIPDLRGMPWFTLMLVITGMAITATFVTILQMYPKWVLYGVGGYVALAALAAMVETVGATPAIGQLAFIVALVALVAIIAMPIIALASGRQARRLLARNLGLAAVTVALVAAVLIVWTMGGPGTRDQMYGSATIICVLGVIGIGISGFVNRPDPSAAQTAAASAPPNRPGPPPPDSSEPYSSSPTPPPFRQDGR